MRNTVEDKEKLADKIDAEDKTAIQEALSTAQEWLKSNDEAEKDDFEEQLKELQRICDPVVAKVYQKNGGQGQGGNQYDDEEFEDL